jgi:hypothetical protein
MRSLVGRRHPRASRSTRHRGQPAHQLSWRRPLVANCRRESPATGSPLILRVRRSRHKHVIPINAEFGSMVSLCGPIRGAQRNRRGIRPGVTIVPTTPRRETSQGPIVPNAIAQTFLFVQASWLNAGVGTTNRSMCHNRNIRDYPKKRTNEIDRIGRYNMQRLYSRWICPNGPCGPHFPDHGVGASAHRLRVP